jgi:hypothetical protein
MIDLRRLLSGLGVATLALVVLLGARPLSVSTILAAYVLVVAGLLLTGLTGGMSATRHQVPSTFERELQKAPIPPSRPSELVRMERELTLASSSALHFHTRLRPLLREIAEARLGAPLTRDRIDEPTWELLRPDAEAPTDRIAPGVPLRRLRAALEELERL